MNAEKSYTTKGAEAVLIMHHHHCYHDRPKRTTKQTTSNYSAGNKLWTTFVTSLSNSTGTCALLITVTASVKLLALQDQVKSPLTIIISPTSADHAMMVIDVELVFPLSSPPDLLRTIITVHISWI